MKLGAYVWYGFSRTGEHYTKRLFDEFPGREPIWGWTDGSVENMEYQIDIASENGLSFFSFDWYYKLDRLNLGLDNFLAAKNNTKMEFCLNVCNHGRARIFKDDWEGLIPVFVKYLTHPLALKKDGVPVIIIYDMYGLFNDFGGTENVKECLGKLREAMEPHGGVYIMACESPYGTPETGAIDFNYEAFSPDMLKKRLDKVKESGFDAITGYNYRRYSPINGSYRLTYKEMTEHHEKSWDAMAEYSPLPYAPCILAGWDCRPWETEWFGNTTGYRSCYAPDRTGDVLAEHILNAEKWAENHPDMISDFAFIYAWDEVCEGGFMIPTKDEGFKMLDGLKSATDKMKRGKFQ